jgi:hypothetical protein
MKRGRGIKDLDDKSKGMEILMTDAVYHESRKRELKIRLMNEGRFDERLKTRVEESTTGSTCLTYLLVCLFIMNR